MNSIDRDDGDRSYVARTVSSGRPRRRLRNRNGVLRTAMITIVKRRVRAGRANAQVRHAGREATLQSEGWRRASE